MNARRKSGLHQPGGGVAMLTLFAKDKDVVLPREIRDIEKTANAGDEITRILRDSNPADRPELPDQRIYIFQRQF
jgi:hypothetical protein